MVETPKKGPKFLQMEFHQKSGLWNVDALGGLIVHSFRYPPNDRIIELAEQAGLTGVEFHSYPVWPDRANFSLYMETGSTAKQRHKFLCSLEGESQIELKSFTLDDLGRVRQMLLNGPAYEVTIEGQRTFKSMRDAAIAQNALFARVEVGDLVIEVVGTQLCLRKITRQEINHINDLADEIDASK